MTIVNTSVIQHRPPALMTVVATINLEDMVLMGTDDTVKAHIHLQGQTIIMKNLRTILKYLPPIKSNQIQNVINAKASIGMHIFDGFDITCA